MIQDIAPHKLQNEFQKECIPEGKDLVFAFRGRAILLHEAEAEIVLPKYEEVSGNVTFLFRLDDRNCFLLGEEIEEPEGYRYEEIFKLRGNKTGPRHLIFAIYTAEQIHRWMRDNRFCGTCGIKTVPAADERAIDCPSCHRRIYPRIQPAVIVGVTNGDQILMTKYANRPFKDYALVAGFTEIGESFEETVRREVMEEVGLSVKNIRYYKSQPWAMADDILAGFYCDVDGDTTILLDQEELKEGSWFSREDVILQKDDFSLTNEMMMMFKNGREPK
ncbi:MAG: NAD(+) diphosphatase [Eubacteriales bacterium]|nr:NAD(+) diphosphatase [Eubacteriales bacterium]